jgi:hypothetical protein
VLAVAAAALPHCRTARLVQHELDPRPRARLLLHAVAGRNATDKAAKATTPFKGSLCRTLYCRSRPAAAGSAAAGPAFRSIATAVQQLPELSTLGTNVAGSALTKVREEAITHAADCPGHDGEPKP